MEGSREPSKKGSAPAARNIFESQLKGRLLKDHGWQDGTRTHIVCALFSAGVSIACVNPTDVVRTRLFNAPEGWYKSGFDAARQLVQTEGPTAFYKGALTHYLRLGPHMVLVFGILEQFKKWFA